MGVANKSLDKIAFLLFAFAVALLPLGLGGNRPLPLGLFQIVLGASVILLLCDKNALQNLFWPRRIKIALAGLLLVLLWAVVQMLPIVPASWAHPLWADAATVLGQPLAGTIALDTVAGWKSILNFATYLLVGVLAYVFGQNEARIQQMLHIVFAVGAAIALYGLLMQAASIQQLLWLPKWAHVNDVTGTFVNRNHFAVYAGMVMVCGCAIVWHSLRQLFKSTPTHQYATALQSYLMREGLWRGLLIAFLFIALLLSHSRAGLLASIAGLLIFVWAYLVYQKKYLLAFGLPALLALLTLGTLLVFSNDIGRFSQLFSDYSSLDRQKVYTETWGAINVSPWFGYGFGNFEAAFRLFRTDTIGMNFNHAHSDWLESLFDLGVPFGLILWASIAVLVSGCVHGVRTRRQHGLYPVVALGVSGLILLHATVEFSLQMPGLVAIWVTLLGMGLAQSWGRSERH